MTSYRYPTENIIYFLTLLALAGVGVLTALPTVFLLPVLVGAFVLLTYWMSRIHHAQLLRRASKITAQSSPQLAALAQDCVHRLRSGPVQLYVLPDRRLNAYTFGFSKPNIVVLYSPMLQVMDSDELRFVIGHEVGHVALGHAWLNTLLGGMAGVPVSFSAAITLTLVFRWWNRACEYSADRAGLLACGNLDKAISALAQLAVGNIHTPQELAHALRAIEQQEKTASSGLAEMLSTHPLILKRIGELRKWAASGEYRRLASRLAKP